MFPDGITSLFQIVALRKESVDRNSYETDQVSLFDKSLSARRAWIEIIIFYPLCLSRASLSARRAWIEISRLHQRKSMHIVALRKESVDRNCAGHAVPGAVGGRSPQGERG